MYSGGAEKTLVKWRLGTSNKQFLPRMGADIQFIVNAPNNACIATSHSDNGKSSRLELVLKDSEDEFKLDSPK